MGFIDRYPLPVAALLKTGGSMGLIGGLIQCLRPFVCLFFGFRLGYSIPLLNFPDQLILLARNRFPIIVGQLSHRSRAAPVNCFHLFQFMLVLL